MPDCLICKLKNNLVSVEFKVFITMGLSYYNVMWLGESQEFKGNISPPSSDRRVRKQEISRIGRQLQHIPVSELHQITTQKTLPISLVLI
jgi:hypothetical protein